MNLNMVLNLLELARDDIDIRRYNEGSVHMIAVTVNDFEGFDEKWNEVFRDYDSELVEAIQTILEKFAIAVVEDFYSQYRFNGFTVVWGYASYDI